MASNVGAGSQSLDTNANSSECRKTPSKNRQESRQLSERRSSEESSQAVEATTVSTVTEEAEKPEEEVHAVPATQFPDVDDDALMDSNVEPAEVMDIEFEQKGEEDVDVAKERGGGDDMEPDVAAGMREASAQTDVSIDMKSEDDPVMVLGSMFEELQFPGNSETVPVST